MAEKSNEQTVEQILQNSRSVFDGGIFQPAEEVKVPDQDEPAAKVEAPAGDKPEEKKPEAVPPETEKKPDAEKPEEKKPEEKKPAETIDTPLFKINVSEEKGTPPTAEEALSLFNKKTGLNLSKPEDIFEKADIIADAVNGQAVMDGEMRLAKDYKAFFEQQLPQDIKAINIAFLEGKDYKTIMRDLSSANVDFTKRFDEYPDVYPLVARYNPDIKKDDFEDMEEVAKKAITNATSKAYSIEFESNTKKASDFQQKQRDRVDSLLKSVEVTMSNVKAEFPDLDQKRLKEIERKLSNFEFSKDLIDENGSYKPDAGVKIAFAVYGKETMDIVVGNLTKKHIAEKEVEIQQRTAEEIELMTRNKNDVPPSSKGTGDDSKGTPEESVMKQNEQIFKGNKSPFANREVAK